MSMYPCVCSRLLAFARVLVFPPVTDLAAGLKDNSKFQASGVVIAGTKYMFLNAPAAGIRGRALYLLCSAVATDCLRRLPRRIAFRVPTPQVRPSRAKARRRPC